MSDRDSILCSPTNRLLALLSTAQVSITLSLDETRVGASTGCCSYREYREYWECFVLSGRALCLVGGLCAYWEGVVLNGRHWRYGGY